MKYSYCEYLFPVNDHAATFPQQITDQLYVYNYI